MKASDAIARNGAAFDVSAGSEQMEEKEDGPSNKERLGSGRHGGGGDKDRKIGHRRVNEEGEVSYKKVHSNQLMRSIQLGIQHSVGVMSSADEDDRDLLMQDFMTVESHVFPKAGSQQTPAHSFTDFKFTACAPLAFRYFLNLFGVRREDFMVSLCSESLRELSNPGASGSLFFLSQDDEFILKTVQHKEAEFLQKLLPGYYMNLNQNPHTLLPKFFGMFCYQYNQKNIRLIVMNNLLPSAIKMHLKFDLKGSTYKRKASKREREKSSPTFKDLDFVELLPEGILLEPETYTALVSTMRRDCRVLESFRIMDYSLLVGVHNLDLAAKEEAEGLDKSSPNRVLAKKRIKERFRQQKQKLVAHSTAMESIQAQTEPIDEEDHIPPGGIPARNHKGERLLLYLGIIDILQSFRMRKKLEHALKAIIHDGDTVSVHRPGFYAHRFLNFMSTQVFKKIPSPLKHSPSRKGKREQSMKRPPKAMTLSTGHDSTDAIEGSLTSPSAPTVAAAAASSNVSTVTSFPAGDNFIQAVSQRPDVVPGSGLDDSFYALTSSKVRSISEAAAASTAVKMDRIGFEVVGAASSSPAVSRKGISHYRHHQPSRQQSVGSLGQYGGSYDWSSSHRGRRSVLEHGTPSQLSVGTTGSAAGGWISPTPNNTWNSEGSPSYTTSSLSGASLGRVGHHIQSGVGNTPIRSVSGKESIRLTKHGEGPSSTYRGGSGSLGGITSKDGPGFGRLETCSYEETEM